MSWRRIEEACNEEVSASTNCHDDGGQSNPADGQVDGSFLQGGGAEVEEKLLNRRLGNLSLSQLSSSNVPQLSSALEKDEMLLI